MIITETITIDGVQLVKNYSDAGYKIQKVGTDEIYVDAVDPIGSGRTYIETNERIETPEPLSEIEEKAMAYDIIVGGKE